MNRNFTTLGIVIKTVALRESDIIISLLTEDLGKLSAIGKGARRSKKRFMGGIDVFDCGIFALAQAKGKQDLYFANSISERTIWLGLRRSLLKFSLSSYCLELTNAFAPEGDKDSNKLFKPLCECLSSIDKALDENMCYYHLSKFNLILLSLSGYNPIEDNTVKHELRLWFINLLSHKGELANPDKKLIAQGFTALLLYGENILGHTLRSHGHFLFNGQKLAIRY